MCGYLSGLSSPSVTEKIATLARSPKSNKAGQTRLPIFSINTTEPGGGLQLGEPARDHQRIEMAAGAGVDLHDRRTGGADALAVVRGRLIALQHIERQLAAQIADRAFEQRGLAGAGGADQVERQDLAAEKPAAVLLRQRIVLGEDARFERDRRAVRNRGA